MWKERLGLRLYCLTASLVPCLLQWEPGHSRYRISASPASFLLEVEPKLSACQLL